ncbi:MAG: regulatory protein [Chloroflexota bacterium]|jgi:regulatory protein|nr:regulatory protein [Chloroflexota bacterium]
MKSRRRSTPESVKARREARGELTEVGPVVEAAAAFLAVRPRSITETKRRLQHLGYPQVLIEQVIDWFAEIGYLDDESFARTWVESRDRARPRGENALRRELYLKGVGREVVDEIMGERLDAAGEAEPDLTAATALLERKRASLTREADERKRRQKAYALLARNGFDPETCRTVASSFVP